MADFILIWNPLWPATSQKLYYREKGDTTWLNLATVQRGIGTYRAVGLEYNVDYEFQVQDLIVSGDVYSNVDDAIVMLCVPVTISVSGTTLTYTFSPEGDDITKYTLDLYKNGIATQQKVHTYPLSDPTTGTFTNLTPIDIYKLRLSLTSTVGGTKSCDLINVPAVSCVKATDVVGTII